MPKFRVLCEIDAFADYVAEIEADSAWEAADLAQNRHADYIWLSDGIQEFDARSYVTLDPAGSPIKETKIGDF